MATILVVEDNALNLRLVTDILEHYGHQVVAAVDVREGRDRLIRHKVDLVLMDIQIPGGGGELLLSEIRADAVLQALPVVAVTASAMRGDEERFLQAGFDAYISKPIDTRRFGSMVGELLKPRAW